MRLSTKSTYGLRAMVRLAVAFKKGAISINEIAREERLSVAYLEQLLNKLRRSYLVKSVRGPKGGYLLARRASSITVGDIVRVLEGETAPVSCVGLVSGAQAKRCKRLAKCKTRPVWAKLARAIDRVLDSVSLGDLARGTA